MICAIQRGSLRWARRRALRCLIDDGPTSADMVGAAVWSDARRGRVTSSGGGGDYAAQMLLGRMRKAGLVRHAPSEGSTRWEVTALGREEVAR
jgi:hypothetical protein